jgi:hypothetical protein
MILCYEVLFLTPAAAAARHHSAAATGGIPENWVGRPDVATQCPASCTSAPTLACISCTVRFGGSFSYSIPTTPGHTYALRFTFSEVWWTGAGLRVLDVRVNGATVLAGVDPFALAGARFTPGVRNVTVVAGAGAGMTVSFVTIRDNAILAALEVSTLGLNHFVVITGHGHPLTLSREICTQHCHSGACSSMHSGICHAVRLQHTHTIGNVRVSHAWAARLVYCCNGSTAQPQSGSAALVSDCLPVTKHAQIDSTPHGITVTPAHPPVMQLTHHVFHGGLLQHSSALCA